MGSVAKASLLLCIILLAQLFGSAASIQEANAVETYSSLTYDGQINFSFEYNYAPYWHMVITSTLSFTLKLDQPTGAADLRGSTTGKGTYSGTYYYDKASDNCPSPISITGSYDDGVSATTNFQANKVDISGGAPAPNQFAESTTPTPPARCYTGTSNGTWPQTNIRDILFDCLAGYTYVITNALCHEFPIQGGTQTFTNKNSFDFKSLSGTAQLTLVSSTAATTTTTTSAACSPSSPSVGSATDCKATVTGSSPTGTVAWSTSGSGSFSSPTCTVSAGACSVRYTPTSGGTHTITASYRGDSSNGASTGRTDLAVASCPAFTLTPTMPPASDPRAFTASTGSAAFRFNVFWGGTTMPVQAAFQTGGGGNGISPSFAFNPATLTLSTTNVIMNVNTNGAAKQTVPITVTATVKLSNSGLTCTANTQVSLVVGDTISDFTLMAHNGQVQITNVTATPAGGPATAIKTGNNGTTTLNVETVKTTTTSNGVTTTSTSTTTLDVGKNSEVRYYNRIVNVPSEADSLLMQLITARVKDQPGALAQALDIGWRSVQDAKYKLANLGTDYIGSVTTTKVLGCALVSLDVNNHDACDGTGTILVIEGQVHYFRPGPSKTPQETWKQLILFLTPNQIVIPLGTELTIRSQSFVNSSITVLEGSALVIDVISKQVLIVDARQSLDMTISYSATPPFSNGQSASLVIGQPDFVSKGYYVCQSCLAAPQGAAFDSSGNLWVADAASNRVVRFSPPFSSDMKANLVVGQSNFTAAGSSTSQSGLYAPVSLDFDSGGNLWVADYYNSRVLEFKPPFSTGMQASLVIGEPDFTSKNYVATTQTGLDGPTGIAFDASGNLWVADLARVLKFSPPFSNGMAASLVIGQSDFTSYSSGATRTQLSFPSSVAFDTSGNLWVADTGNNRTLEFVPPFTNGMPASLVIGQSSFTASSHGCTSSQNTMCFPAGATFDSSGNLWVIDSLNNRALEFEPPFTIGMKASLVIGQSDFASASGVTSAGGLSLATGGRYSRESMAFDSSGNLWVPDTGNNRVVKFSSSNPVTSKSVTSTVGPNSVPQWWESRLRYPVTVDNNQFAIGLRTNSTISSFNFNRQEKSISFTVSGVTGTKGYVNATWPKNLLNGSLVVTMDGKQIPFSLKHDGANYTVYASYSHSQHTIVIAGSVAVPEFPLFGNVNSLVLTWLLLVALLGILISKGLPRLRLMPKR